MALKIKKKPFNSVWICADSQEELGNTFMRFQEYYESPKQFEINWEKIAADVKEAALMVEAKYEKDDGPLTTEQLEQIQLTAPKPKRTRKAK